MMATKPSTSLKERRISLFSARPNLKTSLSRGDNTSPPEAKKPMPNNPKLKSVPSSVSPTERIALVPTITMSATGKTALARRLSDRMPSPSTPSLQRSLKPVTPMPKPSSSSILHSNKAAQTISRTARTNLVPKAKNTSPSLVKKKEAPNTIDTSFGLKISLDHDAVTAFEMPVQEQLRNDQKKVVEALNELKSVEESEVVSSLVEVENHIEEQKSGELENWEEVVVPQVFDEVSKESVVVEEVSKQDWVAVAFTQEEKRDGKKLLEHVDAVVRRVDPEERKPMLGSMVAPVVTTMPAMKKKDAAIGNDVIEETKSKLMGKRKNRVLALVGAFETVISLQEPEGQQIQKALQVQLGQQIQHDEEAEQGFVDKTNQVGFESQQDQEAQEDHNAQKLEGDESHLDEQRL